MRGYGLTRTNKPRAVARKAASKIAGGTSTTRVTHWQQMSAQDPSMAAISCGAELGAGDRDANRIARTRELPKGKGNHPMQCEIRLNLGRACRKIPIGVWREGADCGDTNGVVVIASLAFRQRASSPEINYGARVPTFPRKAKDFLQLLIRLLRFTFPRMAFKSDTSLSMPRN